MMAQRSIIEDLEHEIEHWRQRAEAAEAALRGDNWNRLVAPLSLYETRVLRILVKQDASGDQIVNALLPDYEGTNTNSLKAMLTRIRARLPEHITPPRNAPAGWGVSSIYTIPDRAALAQFLATGVVPEMARAA
jgi:non-ribosomal peptide synthetase component F